MHADTDAIRAYGASTTDLSADLQAAAAVLSHGLGPTIADSFGPVGARFARALADAAAGLVTSVRNLGDEMAASGASTAAAADDYDGVEERARDQIAQVGM